MPSTERTPFGALPDGRRVERIVLQSDTGLSATVLTLGATLSSVRAPDGAELTLCLPDLAAYLDQRAFLGAVVGRYANRIAGGRFELDGTEHRLSVNEPPNTLHGGQDGFDRRLWQAALTGDGVALELVSPGGDQGFPGELTARVTYSLAGNEVRIAYAATTTAPTVVNLTNHTYWNLSGDGASSIEDHVVWLNARSYLPVDAELIPTGAVEAVDGTPFDFVSRPRPIGERIGLENEQLRRAGGYDHTFVLAPGELAARVRDPKSGRALEVVTDAPGVQFYSGNKLDGSPHPRRSGFALETQRFPNAPNQPSFPSSVLRPGEELRSATTYRVL